MKLLPSANSWRTAFLTALGVFLLTRAMTLTSFPIFNDEAIYLQYSQAIHDDWQKNKFISMNGEWGDWKPPLQYWMAAPVIYCGRDPLVAGRAVALFVSFFGLLGFYLFAREFFSEREAVVTAMLYTLCPSVLFQNNQFTAETFLFSTAPFFYWALLKMMHSKQKLPWAALAALVGTALLLFKQSGFLLLVVAIALPFAQLRKKGAPATDAIERERWAFAHWNWKEFAISGSCVTAVLIFSYFAAEFLLPPEFDGARELFNSRWVISGRELFRLPLEVWYRNLRVVGEYIGSYYSWLVPLFVCTFIGFAIRRKSIPELALAFMGLAAGGAVVFLLRKFNEYIFNTAVIVVLLPLLAKTALLIWNAARNGKAAWVRGGLLVCAGITAGYWAYQIILMSISPGRYIERSTPWAVTNYLKGWPTGFGVKEIVAMLEKENAPGVLFIDPQWGNPRTALEVYAKARFPKLRIIPVSSEFLDPSEARKLRETVRKIGRTHWVVFSAHNSDERAQWQGNAERQMCDTRKEIKAYPDQMPIIVCSF
jgi:4-amino-4-deoxy-L-arabinose transferase-like glycosyltransferase